MCFGQKSRNTTTTKQKIKHKNPCRSRGLNPGPLAPKCVTTAPLSQLRVSIVVKPFNCFDALGRNVNKQSQICGPDILNKFVFSLILYMHEQRYLAVSHIYGSMFCCLNMV